MSAPDTLHIENCCIGCGRRNVLVLAHIALHKKITCSACGKLLGNVGELAGLRNSGAASEAANEPASLPPPYVQALVADLDTLELVA